MRLRTRSLRFWPLRSPSRRRSLLLTISLFAFALVLSVAVLSFSPPRWLGRMTRVVHAQGGNPADIGQWGPAFGTNALMVHASVLPNGKVLYWDARY